MGPLMWFQGSGRMQSHADCICLSFIHCGLYMSPNIAFITVNLSNAPSNEIACLKGYNTTLAAVICWANFALSPKCIFFNMYPQMDSPRVCNIATKNVFVKTFPTLCFDMSPKITFLSRYMIALVAFA